MSSIVFMPGIPGLPYIPVWGPGLAAILAASGILFGLYFASFVQCLRWLLLEDQGWRIRKRIHLVMMPTTLFLFFLSMLAFMVEATMLLAAQPNAIRFVYEWDRVYFAASGETIRWLILAVIDGVLIYRCWVIFSKKWCSVYLPIAMWCSCLICIVLANYCIWFPLVQFEYHEPVCDTLAPVILLYVCNIVISLYTTLAIIYLILHVAKCYSSTTRYTSRLYRICWILTESGVVYTIPSVLNLIIELRLIRLSSFTKAEVEVISYLMVLSRPINWFIPGIAFNLIIIRIGAQRAYRQDTWVHDTKAWASSASAPGEPEETDDMQADHRGAPQDEDIREIDRMDAGEITEVGNVVQRDSVLPS